jgi:hypothetical protein
MKFWRFEFKYVTPEKEDTVVYSPTEFPFPIKSTMPKKPVAKKTVAKKTTKAKK